MYNLLGARKQSAGSFSQWMPIVISVFVLGACGDGGSSLVSPVVNPPVAVAPPTTPPVTPPVTTPADPPPSRVLFGPIINAQIDAAQTSNLDSIVETVTSSTSDDLELAGRFALTLEALAESDYVLVTVTGGEDIDIDDNSILDSSPTPNSGVLRALATVADWRNGVNVTALSEMQVRDLVGGDTAALQAMTAESIQRLLDESGARLLMPGADTNGDGVTDSRDLHGYSPYDATFPTQAEASEITQFAMLVESGASDAEIDSALDQFLPSFADAGVNQSVDEGETVRLIGSSIAADNAISFSWQQIGGPDVTLASTTTAATNFVGPPSSRYRRGCYV